MIHSFSYCKYTDCFEKNGLIRLFAKENNQIVIDLTDHHQPDARVLVPLRRYLAYFTAFDTIVHVHALVIKAVDVTAVANWLLGKFILFRLFVCYCGFEHVDKGFRRLADIVLFHGLGVALALFPAFLWM